eukprot:2713270-Amphidinium_carterae.2
MSTLVLGVEDLSLSLRKTQTYPYSNTTHHTHGFNVPPYAYSTPNYTSSTHTHPYATHPYPPTKTTSLVYSRHYVILALRTMS